jgi:hypothetical protein
MTSDHEKRLLVYHICTVAPDWIYESLPPGVDFAALSYVVGS